MVSSSSSFVDNISKTLAHCHGHWSWYIVFSLMYISFHSHSSHMSFSSSHIFGCSPLILSRRGCVGTRCMHERRSWKRQIYIVLFLCVGSDGVHSFLFCVWRLFVSGIKQVLSHIHSLYKTLKNETIFFSVLISFFITGKKNETNQLLFT
jgi:hypothetical protein